MFQSWQEDALHAFAAMYSARTLKEGEQIIFGIDGIRKEPIKKTIKGTTDKIAYAVLNAAQNGQTLTLCMDRTALVDYALVTINRQNKADKLKIAGQMLNMNCLQCHAGQFSEQPLQEYMMRFGYMDKISSDAPAEEVVLRRWRAGFLPDSDLSAEDRHLLMLAVKTVLSYFSAGHTVQEAVSALKEKGEIFCAQWKVDPDEAGNNEDELPGWSRIMLSDHAQIEYPSPVLEDELQVRRVRKLPVSGATLGCSVRRLPIPVSESPVRTPVMLAMIDDINGVVGTDVVEDYNKDCFDLASSFMNYMEEFGRPERILVTDERTYGLVCAMAQQVRVPVERVEELPDIDELIHAYLDMICSSMRPEQELQEPIPAAKSAQSGKGICMICGKELSAEEMKAHIVRCAQGAQGLDCEENLLLRISDADDPDYWMDIALKKDASLAQLDKFLRDVWVDCCGHMSMFICGGEEYYSNHAAQMGGRSMSARIFNDLPCGTELLYDYDFGTTTRLRIEVIGEVMAVRRHRKAVQLTRNIQPQYACIKCGAKAEYVAERMDERVAQSAYCQKCGCADEEIRETLLPILNSPRCGKCGYGAWLLGDNLFAEDE